MISFFTVGNALVIAGGSVLGVMCCLGSLAFVLYAISTGERWVSDALKIILNFMNNTPNKNMKNDRVVRILASGHVLYQTFEIVDKSLNKLIIDTVANDKSSLVTHERKTTRQINIKHNIRCDNSIINHKVISKQIRKHAIAKSTLIFILLLMLQLIQEFGMQITIIIMVIIILNATSLIIIVYFMVVRLILHLQVDLYYLYKYYKSMHLIYCVYFPFQHIVYGIFFYIDSNRLQDEYHQATYSHTLKLMNMLLVCVRNMSKLGCLAVLVVLNMDLMVYLFVSFGIIPIVLDVLPAETSQICLSINIFLNVVALIGCCILAVMDHILAQQQTSWQSQTIHNQCHFAVDNKHGNICQLNPHQV